MISFLTVPQPFTGHPEIIQRQGPKVKYYLAHILQAFADVFAQPAAWQRMQRRAMTRDVGWQRPAERYAALYRKLVSASTS